MNDDQRRHTTPASSGSGRTGGSLEAIRAALTYSGPAGAAHWLGTRTQPWPQPGDAPDPVSAEPVREGAVQRWPLPRRRPGSTGR
ncbi:hypothetical protein ABZ512_00950 [Nocardiopsis dassonvillei]|uniref:hypothetical protein n=1 Tax=Nocardiopsis dassonvillei TaxID=2014 RepID=UPI00340B05FF